MHVSLQNNMSTFRKETAKKKQAWRTKEQLHEVMSKISRLTQYRAVLRKTVLSCVKLWMPYAPQRGHSENEAGVRESSECF